MRIWIVAGLLYIAAVIQTSEAAEWTSSQGFLFTGPKQLQSGTITERFCVSMKDVAHSITTCRHENKHYILSFLCY